MKKVFLSVLIASLFIFQACKKEDNNVDPSGGGGTSKEVTISTADVEIRASQTQKVDNVIGRISARASDNSKVTFTLLSQTVDNAIKIDAQNGEIKVADVSAFDYEKNTIIKGEFKVSSGTSEKKGKITINVEPPKGFKFTVQGYRSSPMNIITVDGYTYKYTIDWGDGSVEKDLTGNASHQYNDFKEYTITIIGKCPALDFSGPDEKIVMLAINEWGDNAWETTKDMFKGCYKLKNQATDAPNLQNVTDASGMFSNANVFAGDLNEWDVSNIKNMSKMFENLDGTVEVKDWNVSNVTDMGQLFNGCEAFNSDISGWNTGKVENMYGMLFFAKGFDKNLSGWDVGKVVNCCGFGLGNTKLTKPSFGDCGCKE